MKKYIFLILSLFLLASCTVTNNGKSPSTTPTPTVAPKVLIPSPTYGSGKHAITVFADFQCPACRAFSKAIGPIFEEFGSGGYATITYKQFPLTGIHPNAERDALAALCGAEQGRYMEYKKVLYALEDAKNMASVSDADRVSAGKDAVDTTKLAACLQANTYLPQVYAEMKEGEDLGVSGTPTVFLDGKKLDNKMYSDPIVFRAILAKWLEVPETTTSGTGK